MIFAYSEAKSCNPCRCYRTRIDCSHKNISLIPNFSYFESVRYIDFSFNQITYIPDTKNLPSNIYLLDLSFNQIHDFGNGSLSDMTRLKYLNLSCNGLHSMPQGFQLPSSLSHLNVSSNLIHTFGKYPFGNIQYLQSLDLYNNHFEYNRRIFYNGLFENLRRLKYLDIGKNSIGTKEPIYPDEIFCHLKSLQTLKIDSIPGASFGKGFRNLTKLRLLRIYNMGLAGYSSDYFENVSQITSLDLSCSLTPVTPSNEQGCYLRRIEKGAIAKLQKLKYLDISHNLKLGFCGLKNITHDLTKTQIKVLKAKKITCPYGYSTVLFAKDIKPLNKTRIREIYMDQNRLEMLEDFAASYLPTSLRLLSLTYNRLRLGKYKTHGIFNLTGIHSLILNYQDQITMDDFSHWFVCDDFEETLECLSNRINVERNFDSDIEQSNHAKCENSNFKAMHSSSRVNTLINSFGTVMNFSQIKNQTIEFKSQDYLQNHHKWSLSFSKNHGNIKYWPYPFPRPENCTFGDDLFYISIIPPNLKRVEFQHSGLGDTVVPQFVSNDTLEEIIVSGNIYQYLLGPVCNVSKVKVLDLSGNSFVNISSYFFIGFIGLKKLYIQDNILSKVVMKFDNGELFSSQSKLKLLNISSNRLFELPEKLLQYTINLQVLDLSHNLLTDWNLTTVNLLKIKLIDLSFNQITFFSKNGMRKLEQSKSVKVNVLNNRFQCNCESLPFFSWMNKNKDIFVSYNNYTCKNITGDMINLKDAIIQLEKSCSSKIGLIVIVGACIILSIGLILGGVIYRYRWYIRYWYYLTKRRYFRGYVRLHDKPQYTFDAFVSYAEDDRLFVFNDLIEGLENDKGKKLCIHHRNFIPGCDISDNITNAIHESEKIVCLITKKFLESEWCNYELNIARVEGMWSRGGENMIIIVLMENISKKDLPIQIIELITNQTYIDYTDYIDMDIHVFIDMLNTAVED